MKKYFLHNETTQTGPFDIEELKTKNLKKDTPIWFEGLNEWTTIENVEELKNILLVVPPPFAAKPPLPPPIPKNTTNHKIIEGNPKQTKSIGKSLLTIAGIIVLALIGYFVFSQMKYQQYQNDRVYSNNVEEDTKASIRNNIASLVIAERNEYSYSELGGISNLKITVTNNTDYLIDIVQVKVTYIKANGDVWDSKIVDFNLINPQTKNTMRVPDTERGTSIRYEIVSIKSIALGLN